MEVQINRVKQSLKKRIASDMKKIIIAIIIISLPFFACSKEIKRNLNISNDENGAENITYNIKTQTNDSTTADIGTVDIGDKIYKEISVNGKRLSKWLTFTELIE